MKKFKNISEILNFAIQREKEARAFYIDLARQQIDPQLKEQLNSFAGEEQAHKKKLQQTLRGNLLIFPEIEIQQLNPADYTVVSPPAGELEFQDLITLAMKKELKAYLLYSHLAGLATDSQAAAIFRLLAQEEALHKIRLEVLYDDEILAAD